MIETRTELMQPLACRTWDPQHRSFFYSDVLPEPSPLLDRWTGLFDKQGAPIYQNDLIRVHYDWRYGWVRALVKRSQGDRFVAQATTRDGTVLEVGFYCFADSYRIGNVREHPGKLVTATEQFPKTKAEPWWQSSTIFRTLPQSAAN